LLRIKCNLGGIADVGGIPGPSNLVAKMGPNSFAENDWTKIGNLLAGRYGHRSIVLGNRIFHIGGEHRDWRVAQ